MKKYLLSVAIMILTVIMMEPAAVADIINFGDTVKTWPGYEVITETRDSIGQPQISGGRAQINAGFLTSIEFIGNGYSTYPIVKPGDLFIDIGFNQTWDYVVSLQQYPQTGLYPYPVYNVNIPLGDTTAYKITGADNVAPWVGYDIRNNHPYALKDLPVDAWGWASFSGFVNGGVPTFAFQQPIAVGDTFTIGWTETCANEVLYETVQPAPVPEPTTLLLLGSGLIGVAGLRKRLKR